MKLRAALLSASLLALPVAVLPALGCAAAPEPQQRTAGLTKPIDPPQPPPLGHGPATVEVDAIYSMWMTDSVRTMCKGPDPFFKFDSAKTMATDEPTMKNLADCMATGPLRGKSIKLIGHADPRGSADYNDQLGLARAQKVKKFLTDNGIEDARVQTATAGKDQASPEPKDWPADRRVEIQLAQ